MGIIKATPLNPRSLAVWPDSVQIGQIAEPICLISPADTTTEQDEANARLIMMAPEMLEAILEIIIEWERQKGLFPELQKDGWMEAKIRNAEAAVAKATGDHDQ